MACLLNFSPLLGLTYHLITKLLSLIRYTLSQLVLSHYFLTILPFLL